MILPLGPHAGPQQLVKLTATKTGIERQDLIGDRSGQSAWADWLELLLRRLLLERLAPEFGR